MALSEWQNVAVSGIILAFIGTSACQKDASPGTDWTLQPDAGDSAVADVPEAGDSGDAASDTEDPDNLGSTPCDQTERIEQKLDQCGEFGEPGLDDDGLNPEEESSLCGGEGTNPRVADTDRDRLSDCEEWALGTERVRELDF